MATSAQRVAQHVAQLSQLRADRAQRIEVAGEKILLVRDGATVHAYSADCPHAGAPLEEGALCNGRIICPWHKGTFDVATGNVLEPPPLLPLDRYPVSVSGDDVFVTPQKIPPTAGHATKREPHYAVIGAGAAGAAACATLRENGFNGRITLIGSEPAAPYDRTSLSKFVPSGDMPVDDVPPLLPPEWLDQHDIERLVAKVARLDVPQRTIHFENGDTLSYDAALLATGGVPKLPQIPGCELAGVHVLRSLHDAVSLVDALDADSGDDRAKNGEETTTPGAPTNPLSVAILGSSFIGLETASALRKRGVTVTVISPDSIPFAKQFGERAGTMFRTLHERNGVTFRLESKVTSLEGEEGNVHEVMLENGEHVAADIVLLATGVTPATDFVSGLPLQKDGGVVVNAGMEAAPGLYAAGDVAAFTLHENLEPVRIEHWRVAQQHARIAAANMCGARHRYTGVPYFWTYHYDTNFEYLGHASDWDQIIEDGDFDHPPFAALYVKDDKVVAVLACQREAQTARLIEAMSGRQGLTRKAALAIIGEGGTGSGEANQDEGNGNA